MFAEQVLWKSMTIRADRMTLKSGPNDRPPVNLYAMDPDGTKLIGDMSEGSVETSRIIMMNSDSSGHQNLGPGCMPSLSPDNSEIVFTQSNVGISDRTNTFVAVADVSTDSQFRLMHSGPEFVSEYISWHPDNERIVFSVGDQASPLSRLLMVNRNAPSNKETIPGPPTDWNILSTDWSPDDRLILFTAHGPPQSVEWPLTGG